MEMVWNMHGLLGHGTLKPVFSQEWSDEFSWFLHADKNSWKLKVTFINFGWYGQERVWSFRW